MTDPTSSSTAAISCTSKLHSLGSAMATLSYRAPPTPGHSYRLEAVAESESGIRCTVHSQWQGGAARRARTFAQQHQPWWRQQRRLLLAASSGIPEQQQRGSSSNSHAGPHHATVSGSIISPATFLATGTAGNGAMAVAGTVLGDWNGLAVSSQLLHAPSPPAALAFMLPLLAGCYYGVSSADSSESFGAMRKLFQDTLIPQMRVLPGWGLCLLALGAGVGEETLFRAFLQTVAINGAAAVAPALPHAVVTTAGVAATSLGFGALHALTPTYFVFATVAGALFGVEYLVCDLPTAATTHWLYDWAALIYVLREWGDGGNGSSTGSGSDSGSRSMAAPTSAEDNAANR